MAAHFDHPLPPLKRLSLQHKQREQQSRNLTLFDSIYTLPAKKGLRSRRLPANNPGATTTFPLPTKKRIRAFQTEFSDQKRGFVDYSICGDDDGEYRLPAKKRRESRNVVCDVDAVDVAAAVCVSNRKRVCAFEPDFVFGDMFDLNVEYKPIVGDECKLESDLGNVGRERIEEVVEEVLMNDGLKLQEEIAVNRLGIEVAECKTSEVIEGSRAEVESSEEKKSVDGVDVESVSNLDIVEMNVKETSEVIEGSRAEADSSEEKKSVEGVDVESVSNLDDVEKDVKETSEVVEVIENTEAVDEARENFSEAQDSLKFEDVNKVEEIYGDVNGCRHDGEMEACVVSAVDGKNEKLCSGIGDLTENVNSEVVEDLGMTAISEIEGSLAEVESMTKKRSVQCEVIKTVSNLDNVDIVEKETSEVATQLGNGDEFNQAEGFFSEEKDLEGFSKFNGGMNDCGHDTEVDACSEGVIEDGNGEKLVSGHGELGNVLKEVTNTDGGIGGDSESEDGVVCEICQSTDGDPSDPIVFCDGCDAMVHASCYGNPLIKGIPEGDWFCDKCIFQAEKPSKPISCCLCPSAGGILKATNDGRWAHLVCAVFVPEAFFLDPQGREGIDVSKICPKRWKNSCYICEKSKGCVVDCSESKCCLSFHVTCGLKEDLCIEYREGNLKKGGIVAGFCKDHTELWKKQQQTGKFKIVARKSDKI